jgi:ABC-type antimicrobial peptide transport system permease subunit
MIHNTGKMYYIDGISLGEKQNILSNLPNKKNCYEIFDFYSQSIGRTDGLDPEQYVFQFQQDKLMMIEELNAFLKEETLEDGKRLEIDMRIIESKKNFDLFKKLGDLLSIALIAFSILSLVLYITNLIISHISKNKKSLGTLKAFGLSNNSIIFIYSTISITMVSISFIFGLFISKLTGTFLIRFVGSCFEIGDVNTLSYVSYPIYWLATFFIVLPSIAIYCKLWFQLRKSTPGDLIYER